MFTPRLCKPIFVASIVAALFTTASTMPPNDAPEALQALLAVVAPIADSKALEGLTQAAEEQKEIRAAIAEKKEADRQAAKQAREAQALKIAQEAEAQRVAKEEAERVRVAAEHAEEIRVAEQAEAQRIAVEAEAVRVAEEEAARVAAEIEAPRLAAEQEEAIGRANDADSLRIRSRTNATQAPIILTVDVRGGQDAIDACAGPILYSRITYIHLIAEHADCGGWERFGWVQEGQVVNLVGSAPTLKTGSYKATQFVEIPRLSRSDPLAAFDHMPSVILQVCIPDELTPGLPLRTILIGFDPA